jgi:hypothetical protein
MAASTKMGRSERYGFSKTGAESSVQYSVNTVSVLLCYLRLLYVSMIDKSDLKQTGAPP